MSHRKRVYPQQQLNAYQQSAPQAFQPPVSPVGNMAPQGQMDQVIQGVGNLNMGTAIPVAGQQFPMGGVPQNAGYAPQNAGYAPQNAAYTPQYQQPVQQQAPMAQQQPMGQSLKPMNQLYPIDLLTELPPPIGDLNLPPPPLMVPAEKFAFPQAVETANNCSTYIRSTLNAVPKSNGLLKKSKLPLAISVKPYGKLNDDEEDIPLSSDGHLIRCKRCRAYLNPFVTLIQDGRRWRCNLCNLANDFPHTEGDSFLRNLHNRPEMMSSVVDHIAPSQYSVRAPPPAVYCFLLDCSANAVKNGLLSTACRTIFDCLDSLPNRDGRTKISIMCVDNAIHYFQIPEDPVEEVSESADGVSAEPPAQFPLKMLDIGDLDEPFTPTPTGLLINLKSCRKNLEHLFAQIPEIFQFNMSSKFALAPGLKAAKSLIRSIGGKIIIVSATLPNLGEGELKPRNEKQVADTKKEASALLSPQSSFYKSFTIDCNKSQVTIDLFLASDSYSDVATQSNLPRYTAGQTHFYPGWSATNVNDVIKFSKEFSKHITMDLCMEGVIRGRGSSGLKFNTFYGHFFNRSSDLCAFPTVPRDQGYVFEYTIDESISKEYCYIQIGALLSSNNAQRRIRVITIALPTTDNIGQVYASVDQLATTDYFTAKAVSMVNSGTSFEETREFFDKSVQDILAVYKAENVVSNTAGGAPLRLCANMRMFPLLMHSLTKNLAFRTGLVPSDHRASALNTLESLPLKNLIKNIYPSVYSLHDMPDEAGLPDETTGEIVLPDTINATMSVLEKYGLYLVDTNSELFLWVGGEAVNELMLDVFGVEDVVMLPIGKQELPYLENSEFNLRIHNILAKVRESDDVVTYKSLYIVRGPSVAEPVGHPSARELSSLRLWFGSFLVEDKIMKSLSYREYLQDLKNKISK